MATYQKQWRSCGAIIRQRGQAFQVESNHNGRRKRETFKTEAEAEAHAKQLAHQIKEEGEAALAITGTARLDALRLLKVFPTIPSQEAAKRLLETFPTRPQQDDTIQAAVLLATNGAGLDLDKPLPTPLAEAARFWLIHHPGNGAMPTIEEALTEYLEHKHERRALTVKELRLKIGRLARSFADVPVSEITTQSLQEWLENNLDTPFNRRKHLNIYRTFFGFVRLKYGLSKNPADDVLLSICARDEREVECYTVEESRRILHAASASPLASKIVPMIALGMFAGLRPAEVQGLDWSAVSLTARRVRVSPETAKKRRSRNVDMTDNLIEWLAPYAQESGPVAPPEITYRRERARIIESAGCKFLKDGFRHSFGTYHLAAFEEPVKTALAMGHRANQDLVFTNYRKLVTREEGQAFWQIKPPRLIEQTASCPE
jgi:integrase